MEFVQQEILVSFGPITLESTSPQIACNTRELFREGQNLQLEEETLNLSLKSEQAGLVRPIPIREMESNKPVPTTTNTTFFKNVFDTESRSMLVRRGQSLFVVAEDSPSLIAYLDEGAVEQLEVGQNAKLKYERAPGETFQGTVTQIVETESFAQEAIANTHSVKKQSDQADQQSQSLPQYRVILAPSYMPPEIVIGSTGRARISTPRRTAFEKLWLVGERWWK